MIELEILEGAVVVSSYTVFVSMSGLEYLESLLIMSFSFFFFLACFLSLFEVSFTVVLPDVQEEKI